MIGSRLAHGRIVGWPDSGCEPNASFVVEHGIVDGDVAIPDRLLPPESRWLQRLGLARSLRVAIRHLHLACGILHRIKDGQIVATLLSRSVKLAVSVQRGVPLIGGDFVMKIRLGVSPV